SRATWRRRSASLCDRVARGCDEGRTRRRSPSAPEDEGVEVSMKTTIVGAYPKISDEHQDLRRALHKLDRGELDEAGIAGVLDDTTAWAIGEIEAAGVDVINDGQVRWDDLLAPVAPDWRDTQRS